MTVTLEGKDEASSVILLVGGTGQQGWGWGDRLSICTLFPLLPSIFNHTHTLLLQNIIYKFRESGEMDNELEPSDVMGKWRP